MQIGVELSRALENKRIFVIDSDEVTRAAIQFMLIDENETHELESVAAALDTSAGRSVDLVVLGLGIVNEQGTDVFARLAAAFPSTRVLLVVDAPSDAAKYGTFGISGVLVKPLTVESVRNKVDTMLGRGPGFAPLRILS